MNGEKLNLKLVSYSSQYSTSYPATNAFDGSTSSYWRTSNSSLYPQSIVIELDDFCSLCGFRIYPNTSSYRVSSFKIYVSSDGLNFNEVYSNSCSSSSSFLEFEFSNTSLSKYVKVEFTGASTSRLYVYEFELYGVFVTRKYLFRADSIIYTVADGVLTALESSELTAEIFQTHGSDEVPEWSVVSELVNPEILYWQDSNEEVSIVATMNATPFTPQIVVSPNYDMSDDTILGVECAYVIASSDVVFAISVDDGVAWYMWTGQAWGTLTDTTTGMTAETINAITTEQWAGLMTTGQFKVRMTLFDENSSFTSFVIDYIN